MPKLLAVFGATGCQGSSVINSVLADAKLSKQYKIRGLTRDPTSDSAKKLPKSVEVVAANFNNRTSIQAALEGVHTVFMMTVPSFSLDGKATECNTAKMFADVAVERGVQYIIFSTLPNASQISQGKHTKLVSFDGKAEAEEHIRKLPIKSAFISLGFFMDNWESLSYLSPKHQENGSWVFKRPQAPTTKMPFIDAKGDTGKLVGAILADPQKYDGHTFFGASGFYSWKEIVSIMSRVLGQNVEFQQISLQEFLDSFPNPNLASLFADGFEYWEKYGYWGTGEEQKVAWSIENAKGKLSTLEEFLIANPLHLA